MRPVLPQTTPPKDYLFKAYNPTLNQTRYFNTASQLNSFTGSCCTRQTMGYVYNGCWNGWNLSTQPY